MKLMNRSGTGSGIFDIKTIKSFYDARDRIVQSKENSLHTYTVSQIGRRTE